MPSIQAPLLLLLPLLLLPAGGTAAEVKVNCFPEENVGVNPGRERCESRRCEYVAAPEGNSPYCLWRRHGYTAVSTDRQQVGSVRTLLRRAADYRGPFPDSRDEDEVVLTVKEIGNHQMRISFTDVNNRRFTVPKAVLDIPEPGTDAAGPDYSWQTDTSDSHVTLRRSGKELLSVQRAGLVYSDQFLQAALRLGCEQVYGFGEHNHERLLHDRSYRRWTIFTRDASPTGPVNLYSAHPYFMCGDPGQYMGVLLKNANAMEVELTPDGIVFRTVGGVLDFYVFLGDTPEQVTMRYSAAIGHPLMPPYWSLGFQLCRWGYRNVTEVQDVIRRNRAINLPYDVQYGDIDYMQNTMDFTIDKDNYQGLHRVVEDLHNHGQKYFVILDPAISSDRSLHQRVLESGVYEPYEDGVRRGVFLKNQDGSLHEGEVWPGRTVFPDFTLDATQQWWEHWVRDFYYNKSIKIDGLWIDMNEPASFTYESHKPQNTCPRNKWNYPPYIPTSFLGDRFYEKTMCMEVEDQWGSHYNTHSLYGHGMAMHSYQTLRNMFPGTRPIVFSRSTFAGTGRYAQHWLGDNHSRWSNLHWSIVTMLEFNLFGFPYSGADICGFVFDAQEEMCVRWTQLGAFYPFSRNHNVKETDGKRTIDQDPAVWSAEAQEIMKKALFFRYRYLPYLYTLFHYSHTLGTSVVRSLNHEFPDDPHTAGIDRQFLWGSAMLVTPVLEPNQTSVAGYFPADGWYDAFDGTEMARTGNVTLAAPLDTVNVHIRKGYILPWQEPSVTTTASRQNPLGLTVALQRHGANPKSYRASGSLFWDDGVSFETTKNGNYKLYQFTFSTDAQRQHKLTLRPTVNGYPEANNLVFDTVIFYGLYVHIQDYQVHVNDNEHTEMSYNASNGRLQLQQLQLAMGESHTISLLPKAAVQLGASVLSLLLAMAATAAAKFH